MAWVISLNQRKNQSLLGVQQLQSVELEVYSWKDGYVPDNRYEMRPLSPQLILSAAYRDMWRE